MAKTRSKPADPSVEEYLAARASPEQLVDCRGLMAMCARITGEPPTMWGTSLVSYGAYAYRSASGYQGRACLAAFAIRGRDLVVYLAPETEGQAELLAKLGKHKMGKSCLYFRRLADLDLKVLEQLIADSAREAKHRYPPATDEPKPRGRRSATSGQRG